MPEGPEVKILVDQLNLKLKNSTITDFIINSGRYSKNKPANFDNFTKSLPLKINSVNCKGKFIWFELSNDWMIWNTLGLSGGWKTEKTKHGHITLKSVLKDKEMVLYYDDYRNFGTFKFMNNTKDLEKKLKDLGTDVLGSDFNKEYCLKILNNSRNQKKTLPEVLMNQKLFCGVGNYLKSEILYQSKISPFRLISDLNDKEKEDIFKNTKSISYQSYKKGGASVRDFSDLDNDKGLYTDVLKVYFKKTDSLGNKVKKETTKDKRTTHWVPEIQK